MDNFALFLCYKLVRRKFDSDFLSQREGRGNLWGLSSFDMDISHMLCVFTDAFLKSKRKRKALDTIKHSYPQCNAPQEVPHLFKESGIQRKIFVMLLHNFSL